MSYPTDKTYLPITSAERPGLFSARYYPYGGYVGGWVFYDTRRGQKRKYLFHVSWRDGRTNVKISAADASKGISFFSRDNKSVYGCDLSGMAESYRKDIRDYVLRISNHTRDTFYNWKSFLEPRAENHAVKVAESKEGKMSRILLRDGQWAIFKYSVPPRADFFAELLPPGAEDQHILLLRSKLFDEEYSHPDFGGPLVRF